MRICQVLVLTIAIFAASSLAIPCNCGLGPGIVHETVDGHLCHGRDHKLVIRADPYIAPLVKEKLECNYVHKADRIISGGPVHPPQKDYVSLCSCGNTIVTPAHVPPPPCHKCTGEDVCEAASTSSDSYHHHHVHHHCSHHHNKLSHVPADPVSVALAYKQQLYNENIPRNSIADRDIAFGFQKLPIEVNHECKHTINEGSLNEINGQVLEIKLPRPTITKTVDEEAYEELLAQQDDDLEEEHNYHHGEHKQSLADLGYVNVKSSDSKFVEFKNEKKPICGKPLHCCDGFRPGKVILKEEVKLPDYGLKERETACAGHLHHKSQHVWRSGHSNTIFKHVGCHSGCHSESHSLHH